MLDTEPNLRELPVVTVLERARAGSVPALSELHRRYLPTVHGLALARVGPNDADDLCQDVFVRAFGRLHQLRDPKHLGTWLCTVANNLARDRLRRERRRPQTDRTGEEPVARAGSDPELAERVLACIRSLPEAYRDPLVLRLVEGLDGPTIAKRTGKTEGSLRVNLHRGMTKLRTMLEKEGWP